MVIHVVLLRPNPDLDPAAVNALRTALAALPGQIPGITRFVWGPNASPEGMGRGFELGFVMESNAAARDVYLSHPAHVAVGPLVAAVADEVLVFDLEA